MLKKTSCEQLHSKRTSTPWTKALAQQSTNNHVHLFLNQRWRWRSYKWCWRSWRSSRWGIILAHHLSTNVCVGRLISWWYGRVHEVPSHPHRPPPSPPIAQAGCLGYAVARGSPSISGYASPAQPYLVLVDNAASTHVNVGGILDSWNLCYSSRGLQSVRILAFHPVEYRRASRRASSARCIVVLKAIAPSLIAVHSFPRRVFPTPRNVTCATMHCRRRCATPTRNGPLHAFRS